LKAVYSAGAEEAGRGALEDFGKTWNGKCPMVCQLRLRRWDGLSGFFKYPPEIRRAVYTADAIESMNHQPRKAAKNRPPFPADDAIFKILYPAIRNACGKRAVPVRGWGRALNQFGLPPE
jgi:transposase-like protein